MKKQSNTVAEIASAKVPTQKNWSEMTIKERFHEELNRHYKSLELLGFPNGKKASVKLLALEREAHKIATDQCNGDGKLSGLTEQQQERTIETILTKIQDMNPSLKGLFFNGDARGYSLKLKDSVMREIYNNTGLQQDWGGYGLLAPEITGRR